MKGYICRLTEGVVVGQRRIRVVTLALPTTSVISELYASADQVAIATLLANKAVERGISSKLEDARDAVTNKVVDILSTYKSHMGTQGPSPQLIVPDNLKHLPMLLLGLVKHVRPLFTGSASCAPRLIPPVQVGIRQSTKIPSDLRAYAMALLTTLPSQLLVPYLHPSFYALHTMPPDVSAYDDLSYRQA
jgi:protein transport protein SEC24